MNERGDRLQVDIKGLPDGSLLELKRRAAVSNKSLTAYISALIVEHLSAQTQDAGPVPAPWSR